MLLFTLLALSSSKLAGNFFEGGKQSSLIAKLLGPEDMDVFAILDFESIRQVLLLG